MAGRAPGPATFRSAPLSVRWVAPPDNGARYRKSRAFGPRARARTSPPRSASAERSSSSKARALAITALSPPAPGDPAPSSAAARLDGLAVAGPSGAVQADQLGGTAPAGPAPRLTCETRAGSWGPTGSLPTSRMVTERIGGRHG
jgi:hypothetical protein